ncbi:MAG: citryl-CoA lyase [Pseudomonadota bacterium]
MNPGTEFLAHHAGRLRTAVGACYPGSHANFRGHDLHADLRTLDWVELYVFGITGRRFTKAQVQLMHAIWVYTSYPDARLWNNRIAALATSARSSSNLGMAAAIAVSEATVYGGRAGFQSMQFLLRARSAVDAGTALPDFVQAELNERRIYGYGRPIHSTDERIPWMMALVAELGFDQGRHLQLAFAVEKILLPQHPQLRMNYAALHAALVADLGLSLREYQLLRVPTFMAGKPQGAIFPTPCNAVTYEGVEMRAWPA